MIDKIIEKAVNKVVMDFKQDMERIALSQINDFYVWIPTSAIEKLRDKP
jgi:hypothetical protein